MDAPAFRFATVISCKANALSGLDPRYKVLHSDRNFSTRTCDKPRLDLPPGPLNSPYCLEASGIVIRGGIRTSRSFVGGRGGPQKGWSLSIAHYLGHRNLQNTARYIELNANRFNGWFSD